MSMQMPARYINSRRSRCLRPVLKGWIRAMDRYIRHWEASDCPWWYTERATLSCLAAGAWLQRGYVALEEFGLEKGRDDGTFSGRCDLKIDTSGHTYSFEAKQAWCGIGSQARNGLHRVRSSLKEAVADARQLSRKEMGSRFGLCFAIPHLPKRDEPLIDQQLDDWLRGLELEFPDCILAWSFPSSTRKLLAEQWDRFYPGVALIAKQAKGGF